MRPLPVLYGAVALLVSLGVAVLLYRAYGTGGIGYGVRAFAVSSPSSLEITFQVDKPAADTVVCRLRARDEYGTETGAEDVVVGPAGSGTVVVTHELATRARAVSGEVTACVPQSEAGRLDAPEDTPGNGART